MIPHPVRPRREGVHGRIPAVATALALLWVVGVAVALFFVPVVAEQSSSSSSSSSNSSSSSSSSGSEATAVTRETRPLIAANGAMKGAVVLIAALIVAIGWRAGPPRRSVLLRVGALAMVFVVITGFSIGLLFLPVPLLLLTAGLSSDVSDAGPGGTAAGSSPPSEGRRRPAT